MRKNEKVGKTFRLHNGAIRRLHIGAGFRAYRSEQERAQIGAALVFQIGINRLQIGLGFQIEAKIFQIREEITNRDKWDFKSG